MLLALLASALFAGGTYLLMQRKLSRLIIGVGLIGHGANVVFVAGSRRGLPPFIGSGDESEFADPLPQALVLTAIVISFGVTALLLALAYRSWLLTADDEVDDDVADRLIGRDGSTNREVVDAEVAELALAEHDEHDEHDDDRDDEDRRALSDAATEGAG
ncbi:MAG: sodium:proton antiporter [Desertimonas sp.]